ncbi:hypothetical protein GCM10009118_22830 [Wandonia haliotis]|uniref:Uncharacterized protein n=2 Tax=Wandonia haliotis TaxID=574963 RepID=A0ABP3Y6N6_9FLAO
MLTVVGVLLLLACKKEIAPITASIAEPWMKFIGEYKVYDTMGVYLYDMEIVHKEYSFPNGGHGDSIYLQNFDNNFNLSFTYTNQNPNDFLPFGFYDSIKGITDNKTWQIYNEGGGNNNRLINDTLYLTFEKTNISYWMQDLVPYYHCICKQIAVKQH